jgi:hypothetical protein
MAGTKRQILSTGARFGVPCGLKLGVAPSLKCAKSQMCQQEAYIGPADAKKILQAGPTRADLFLIKTICLIDGDQWQSPQLQPRMDLGPMGHFDP